MNLHFSVLKQTWEDTELSLEKVIFETWGPENWECDALYTKRESQLVQNLLKLDSYCRTEFRNIAVE
jgi:hypothetical protein